jgi:hypothetical protein
MIFIGMKILMIKIQLALLAAGASLYEYMKNGGRFY